MHSGQSAGQLSQVENSQGKPMQQHNATPSNAQHPSAGRHGAMQPKAPDDAHQHSSTIVESQRPLSPAHREDNGTRPTHAKTTERGVHRHGQAHADPADAGTTHSSGAHGGPVHDRQHEMDGQVTNPDTDVHFKANGHY